MASISRFIDDTLWIHAIYIVQQSRFTLVANLWFWTLIVYNYLNLRTRQCFQATPALFLLAFFTALPPHALASEWYLGIGAGVSTLKPQIRDGVQAATSTRGSYAGFILGREISEQFAVEAHLHLPGRGEVGNNDVDYSALDLALRYRVLQFAKPGELGTMLFVMGGFGSVQRDTEASLTLENDTRFHFSLGGGVEARLTPSVSLRAQALYIDEDVQVGNVALLWHWGQGEVVGRSEPATTSSGQRSVTVPGDIDGDGVADATDQCPGSRVGFPVRENGCALFRGTLPAIAFVDRTSTLLPTAYAQLDMLVAKLTAYPDANVELIAHTDDRGTLREQSILTRQRLRIVASYLSKNGIRGNRLILRSMGGSQPVFDNQTVEGRTRNNRIEIFEHTP